MSKVGYLKNLSKIDNLKNTLKLKETSTGFK